MRALLAITSASVLLAVGCRDTSRFATHGDRFEGAVVQGNFVRAGIAADARMCLTLDTDRLQDVPGELWTSDGRFQGAPLRPIPQLWHDPLSTLSFGEGREQNLVYAASPSPSDAGDADGGDVFVVVSLMRGGNVEVRLLRGAPRLDAGVAPPGGAAPVFGVFDLERRPGPCAS